MAKKKKVYICDPRKNHDCTKRGCFLYDGECHLTADISKAYISNGRPLTSEMVKEIIKQS